MNLQFHDTLNDRRVCGGRGEYCPYKGERPPHRVMDALATAQVDDVKTKVSESVISLKQSGIGVCTVELGNNRV